MLSPDFNGVRRKGHSTTYDVTNLHVSRFLWRATIDCILTELIEKNVISFWCKIGAKTGQYTRTAVLEHGLLSRVLHWLRSKLFRPVEGMNRVKDRENKKVEKNEKERSKEKKSERFSKKRSKFWLMRMRQVKCCTFLHGNCIRNLLQRQKVHF